MPRAVHNPLAHDTLSNDVFLGNILVMAFGSLRCRSDDRLRKFLILNHSIRHFDSAYGAFAGLVLSPCMA